MTMSTGNLIQTTGNLTGRTLHRETRCNGSTIANGNLRRIAGAHGLRTGRMERMHTQTPGGTTTNGITTTGDGYVLIKEVRLLV